MRAWLVVAVVLAGCSGGGGRQTLGGGGNGDDGDGGAAQSSGSGGDASASSVAAGPTTGAGAGGDVVAEVYGHSADILYKLDPITHEVTEIGPFTGCSSVIDLAIDKDNNIIAAQSSGLYAIDKNTAACTLVSAGAYPNSLSYVPAGTLDPDEEALVGYQGGTYVRINPSTGSVQNIGSIGGGFSSSGDIVSVIGGGSYLTVTGNSCGDCLIEVNPSTGGLVQDWGSVGYGAVFGLAFWGGSAFGFTSDGDLFEISFDGGVLSTTPIAIPGAPSNLSFWGAGSATSAPLVVPE